MRRVNRYINYPIWLFVFLLIAKIIYIFVESHYNYDVLYLTTSSELSRNAMEALNERGHTIASIGFTLLLIPLFYWFYKNRGQLEIFVRLSILSLITFISFYFSLNLLVDYIVKQEQRHRYSAYYTNLIKYSMLNNIISYNSFIPNSKMENLDLNSKILLTNIYLLSSKDKKLIEKFREKGEENAIKLFTEKYKGDKYIESKKIFIKMAKEIEIQWINFDSKQKKILDKLQKESNETKIKKAFDRLNSKLSQKYNRYEEISKQINKKIQKEISLKKLSERKQKLDKYFKYQNYSKAQKQYDEEMMENFGHKVNSQSWLGSDSKVSLYSIEKNIRKQIEYKAKKEMFGVPSGLGRKAFLNHINIKNEVAKILKENDILIPIEFDYSYADFKKYYLIMIRKKKLEQGKLFENKLEDKIGENDLKFDSKWEEFVRSDYVAMKLKDGGVKDVKDIKLYQDVLATGDIGNFDLMIYQPKAIKVVSKKIIYEKEEFYKDKEVMKKGDESIKLLYIPPIALGLSLVALFLNFLTVVSMLLKLGRVSRGSRFLIISIIILIIGLFPIVFSKQTIESKFLEKEDKIVLIYALKWSSYWIKYNYMIHE